MNLTKLPGGLDDMVMARLTSSADKHEVLIAFATAKGAEDFHDLLIQLVSTLDAERFAQDTGKPVQGDPS